MSILKKVFNAFKRVFAKSSRRKKKSGKKKKVSVRKKTSVLKVRKKSKKIPVSSRRKKPSPPPSKKSLAVTPKTEPLDVRLGEVTHYFDRIKVCVIRIDQGMIKKGDRLLIKGNKSQLAQKVVSMQIENEDVSSARKGQLIGLKVTKPVSVGDGVFKKK